jgi:hypothetical protein
MSCLHSVYGGAQPENGIIIPLWVEFKSGCMTHEEAVQSAIKTIRDTMSVESVWIVPHPPDAPCSVCGSRGIEE